MSLFTKALSLYEDAVAENRNSDFSKKLRSAIMLEFGATQATSKLAAIDNTYNPARRAASTSNNKIVNLTPESFQKKKDYRISRENGVVAHKPVLEEVYEPDMEIAPVEAVIDTDELLANAFQEFVGMTDNQIIQKFGSLKGVKNYANEVLGLGLATNARRGATLTAFRAAIDSKLNNVPTYSQEEE